MIADDSNKVFEVFTKYDLNRASMVKREQLSNILDDLLLKHGQSKTELSKVPTQIETELWEKTSGNQNGEVILADYVQTVHKARQTLHQKIQETEAQKKKVQEEIDMVRNLIEKAKQDGDEQQAQRLIDRLRYLGIDSMKNDEELEGSREDLKLLSIVFNLSEVVKPDQNITPVDVVPVGPVIPGVTGDRDGTNKSVHNSSFQNISIGNPLNISHNINRSAGSQRSILDTSAQRIRNQSMLNAKDLASRPPAPIYVPPPPVVLAPASIKSADVPIMVEQNIATTVAHSPFQHQESLLHRESPRPYEGQRPEYHRKKLYCIFWLSIILLLLEIFQMMEKPLMLGLLFSLSIVGMFLLHRFSPRNVKYTIALGFLSIILDWLWLVVKLQTFLTKDCGWACYFSRYLAQHKWPFETHHYKLHYAIVIAIMISLFLKFVISVLLCWFRRQSEQDNERSIRLFGHQLIISDEAYAANPQGYGFSPQQTYLS